MKAVFVHDHQFVARNNLVYSDKLPYLTWQRYLAHFRELSIIARVEPDGMEREGLPLSSGPAVSFEFVESVSNLRGLIGRGGDAAAVIAGALRDADILIARLPSELGLLACSIARRLNKPYLVEVVACAWDALWNYGSIKGRAYAPLLFARMRQAVSHAPYVSYVSQEFLQTRYPAPRAKNVVAVSNVELPAPDSRTLARRFERLSAQPDTLVIGLIGSLKTRYKGVDLAIDALAQVRSAGIDAELRVLGGGDPTVFKQIAIAKNVEEQVHFDGLLDRKSVMVWLDALDIYIQPSLQEGVPRALIEAMSRGCPAIGSRCGGIPELLPEGCLVPVGDSRQLYQRLRSGLDSLDWRISQAEQNVARAQKFEKQGLDARRSAFLKSIVRDIDMPIQKFG